MDIRRQVGLNIRRIRLQRGISQENLAYEAEVNRAHMSAVERGVANPTVVFLDKLAKVLRCDVGDLTGTQVNPAVAPKNLPRGEYAQKKPKRRK